MRWWPGRWITEAHDQTRGWFYSQLGASMIAFGESPYKAVLMHGFALDSQGRPMSKSLGNNIEPQEMTQKYGIDSFRFYLLASNPPWEDLPFQISEIANAQRMLNILWNVYVFTTTYMSLDKFKPEEYDYERIKYHLKIEDRWCLSKLENLKKAVGVYLEEEMFHKAAREIKEFVLKHLSRWYVKLIRDRTWLEGENISKYAAYYTLHTCLVTLSKLLLPFTPHIAEEMYLNLQGSKPTVAMENWPEPVEERIDMELEEEMALVQEMVDIVLSLRQKAGINLRWPLPELVIKESDEKRSILSSALKRLGEILKEQTNVKDFHYLESEREWERIKLKARPVFGKIGPVFKEKAKEAAAFILETEPHHLKKMLESGKLQFKGVPITKEMVLFEKEVPEHYLEAEFSTGVLYLNTELTEECKKEGFAREIIRRIQEMRKEMDLPLEKWVNSWLKCSDVLRKMVEPWFEYISKETRSELKLGETPPGIFKKEWKIKDENIVIGLKE
ncbi:MAG TPA: hypothetical protein EYP29_00080 [Thermoplasmata archaeon]|nr:hypothetical protein [Thermoplasmata archaeon]